MLDYSLRAGKKKQMAVKKTPAPMKGDIQIDLEK
jgi:hypothetical protein